MRHYRAGEKPCDDCREANRHHASSYYRANKDAVSERSKKRYRDDPSRNKASRDAWMTANRGKMNAYYREYYRENQNRWRVRDGCKRAMASGVSVVSFTAASLAARIEYFGHKCWVCRGPFEEIDHVKPLSKGGPHVLSNIRPICRTCNRRKKDKWPT